MSSLLPPGTWEVPNSVHDSPVQVFLEIAKELFRYSHVDLAGLLGTLANLLAAYMTSQRLNVPRYIAEHVKLGRVFIPSESFLFPQRLGYYCPAE